MNIGPPVASLRLAVHPTASFQRFAQGVRTGHCPRLDLEGLTDDQRAGRLDAQLEAAGAVTVDAAREDAVVGPGELPESGDAFD